MLRPNTREVRHLHLRLADENDAQRARIAIEDGLATADFGDFGRLILVRRLALSSFTGDMTGPAAARAIEVAFRALLPSAVHASEPNAAAAPVVWFVDKLEALIEALSLRVKDCALDGWFWRKVDPLLAETTPDVAALLNAIVEHGDASTSRDVAIRALVHRWRSWTDSDFRRFLAAIPEPRVDLTEDAAAGAGVTHIYRRGGRVPPAFAGDRARDRVALAARENLRKARWVAYCELVALDVLSADVPASKRAALVVALVGDALRIPAAKHDATLAVERPAAGVDEPEIESKPRRVTLQTQDASAHRPTSRRPLDEPRLSSLVLPPWLAGARISPHAGFFMLLNAWRAIGFHEWIEAQPSSVGKAWLNRWAARLRMSDDDAQRRVWQSLPECGLPDATSTALTVWMTQTRCWLRTQARIGPASLVSRVGAIAITRTHIDVAFPLVEINLRARRAGLDQNPGWVPWLGRIVAFHFVETEIGHA
jgi:hypothetical protein